MKTLISGLAAIFLAGCAAQNIKLPENAEKTVPVNPSAAVVLGKEVFRLSPTQNLSLESKLPGLLLKAQQETFPKDLSDEEMKRFHGFTYSLSPNGVVYPYSSVEVSCIVQQKYSAEAQPECDAFFAVLRRDINELLKKYDIDQGQSDEEKTKEDKQILRPAE